MSQGWLSELGTILLAISVFILPGLVIGLAARLTVSVSLGLAPLLSLGVAAVAVLLAMAAGLRWELRTYAALSGGLVIVSGLVATAARYWGSSRLGVRVPAEAGSVGREAVHSLVLLGGAAIVLRSVLQAIPSPSSPSQSYDAAFHLNGIAEIVRSGDPGWANLARVSAPGGPAGFYPPLFHDLAALLSGGAGLGVVVASNVEMGMVSVMWVLSSALFIRVLFGDRIGLQLYLVLSLIAMPLFPALFLFWGPLWPNALGQSVLPGVAACIVSFLPVRASRPLPLPVAGVGCAMVPLLALAHPNAFFTAVGMAVLVVFTWAGLAIKAAANRRKRVIGVCLVAAFMVALVVGWFLMRRVPLIRSVMAYDWRAVESMPQAVGEALTYATGQSPPVYVLGALTLLGVYTIFRSRQWRWLWLVTGHALVVWLYVLAAGDDSGLSSAATGLWYNDPRRLAALLPLLGVPLVVLALGTLEDALRPQAARALVMLRATGRAWSRVSVAVVPAFLTVGAMVVLLPAQQGRSQVAELISKGYATGPYSITDDSADAVFRSISAAPPGTVVGSPWTGEVYAGIYSGRAVVFPHFNGKWGADRDLIAKRFKEYQTDAQVCAAVRRLGISVAVERTPPYYIGNASAAFPGLLNLSGVPGLKKIAGDGRYTAYSVAPC